MVRLRVNLANGGRLRAVLVSWPGDFLARTSLEDARVVTAACFVIFRLNELRWGACTVLARVTVNDLGMRLADERHALGSCFCSGLACLGAAGALLTRHVGLGETLFARLRLPVVVANTSTANNHTAAELAKHAASSHNGDLARAVGKRQDFLSDQVVFLHLIRDDLVQRTILVEKQVRIAIAQNTSAFGCEHEKLIAPLGD